MGSCAGVKRDQTTQTIGICKIIMENNEGIINNISKLDTTANSNINKKTNKNIPEGLVNNLITKLRYRLNQNLKLEMICGNCFNLQV